MNQTLSSIFQNSNSSFVFEGRQNNSGVEKLSLFVYHGQLIDKQWKN